MKQFINNKKLIALLVTLIIFIGILVFSFNNFGSAPYVQQLVNDVTAVVGRVISKPVDAVNRVFSSINNLQDTFEENKELKKELDRLAEMQAELVTITEENKELKAELELQATLTDYDVITGSVIARSPDKWIDQVIIDRGSMHGLTPGMSVMSNNGLVGRVSEVSPTSSKVTLLTTTDEAAVLTSSEILQEDVKIFGVVIDYEPESGYLIMEQITSTETIEVGADIVTSGLGGLVPRGLIIGKVAEVTLDKHGLGQRVYVEPAADFENIRFVTIINRDAEIITETGEESE